MGGLVTLVGSFAIESSRKDSSSDSKAESIRDLRAPPSEDPVVARRDGEPGGLGNLWMLPIDPFVSFKICSAINQSGMRNSGRYPWVCSTW